MPGVTNKEKGPPVAPSLEANLAYLERALGIGASFDLLLRRIRVGGREAALLLTDALVAEREVILVMDALLAVSPDRLAVDPLCTLLQQSIPFSDVATHEELDRAADIVLTGQVILLVDGITRAISLDLRQYPGRGPAEPDLERVTRGARDGFVENFKENVALIRRRLRHRGLRFEHLQVGTVAPTDVALAFIEGLVDPDILQRVREQLETIRLPVLTMGAKSLAEALSPSRFNPFPRVRFTERPDVAAAHLVEGHVILVVDTTPIALILPSSVWHFTQHAEEYLQNAVTGTWLRWIRFLGIMISFALGPLWLMSATLPSPPEWLRWTAPADEAALPLTLQFLVLEVGIDLIRIAIIHVPGSMAQAMGIVGGILLGNLAVDIGLFNPHSILYIALVAIGYFATPSIEFAYAVRLFRLLTLILVAFFGAGGFVAGVLFTFFVLWRTRPLGVPYLWPLIPLDLPILLRLLFRFPIPYVGVRAKANPNYPEWK